MKKFIAILIPCVILSTWLFCLSPASNVETAIAPTVATTAAAASTLIPLRVTQSKPRLISQTARFEAGNATVNETSYTSKTIVTVTSVYECESIVSLK